MLLLLSARNCAIIGVLLSLLGFASAAPRPRQAPGAPGAPELCRQALLSACRLIRPARASRTVTHLEFTSRTVFRSPYQKKPKEVETPASFYAQGNKLYFQTPQVTLWQDGQYVATVMQAQRVIYLTRVPPAGSGQTSPAQFAMLRDSLIERGKLVRCETTTVDGQKGQRIALNLASVDQIRYHATALSFLLGPKAHLRELTVTYPVNSPVSYAVYSITQQEFISSMAKLPSSARAMVLNKDGQPLPAYRNYQVVDQTKLTRFPY